MAAAAQAQARRAAPAIGILTLAAAGVGAGLTLNDRLFTALALAVLVPSMAIIVWNVDPAWTVSAAIGLSIFNGNWGLLGLPGFLAPDRLILVLAVVTVLLRGPGARDRPEIQLRPVHWILLALSCYTIGSALVAGTLIDSPGSYRLLDRLGIVPFVAFLIAPVVFYTSERRRILLTLLVCLGAYLGATALAETIGPRALVWPRYILDPSITIHLGRARGPFLQASINGMAMYMCALAALWGYLTWRSRGARLAAAAIGMLCVTGLLFTLQRSIWLGASIAGVATLLAVRGLRRLALPVGVAAVVLVAVALTAIPGFSEKVSARSSDNVTIWDRSNLNQAALNMLAARPLLGFGYSTFEHVGGDYFGLADNRPVTTRTGTPVHNVFTSNLAELGLLGTSLWVAALVMGVCLPLLRRGPPEATLWRAILGSTFLLWTLIAMASPLLNVFPTLMLWLIAGIYQAVLDPDRGFA